MKIENIVNQLQSAMPLQTDLFTETQSIVSLTRSGSTVTATTSTAHSLITSNVVNIIGAKDPFPVATIAFNGDTSFVSVITSVDHDLSVGFDQNVEIVGATIADYNGTFPLAEAPVLTIDSITRVGNTATVVTFDEHGLLIDTNFKFKIVGAKEVDYNGIFTVDSIIDTKTFTYTVGGRPNTPATGVKTVQAQNNRRVFFYKILTIPAGSPAGTIFLLQNSPYNESYSGRYAVTVTGATTFEYTINTTPESPAQGTIIMHKGVRITGAVDGATAFKAYTERNITDLWAYVTLSDEVTSKDRNALDDSTATIATGTEYRLREIRQFQVFVISNASASLLGRPERDLMIDIKRFLYKSLLNVSLPTDLTTSTIGSIIPVNNGFELYTGAYYIHQFTFETDGDVVFDDAVDLGFNVAFRNICMNINNDITPVVTADDFQLDP